MYVCVRDLKENERRGTVIPMEELRLSRSIYGAARNTKERMWKRKWTEKIGDGDDDGDDERTRSEIDKCTGMEME
jgi:hypothetical protein